MTKRIVFTGGSGKAGRHVVPWLKAKGHDILNLDLKPLDCPGVNTLITDVTKSGEVFNALSMHFDFGGYETGNGPAKIDAVVHFAAIPRVLIQPDNVTYSANVISTYNVIEAAVKLGIRKIIIASSETTYGVCFAEGDKDFHNFPLEEDYDSDPMDSYGLSKVINEKTARAFACVPAQIFMHFASAMSSSPMSMTAFRDSWPIPCRASAMPGAISMRATLARSSISAWKRMEWVIRFSTP
jgi:UDP-glucose 4-epimerase